MKSSQGIPLMEAICPNKINKGQLLDIGDLESNHIWKMEMFPDMLELNQGVLIREEGQSLKNKLKLTKPSECTVGSKTSDLCTIKKSSEEPKI